MHWLILGLLLILLAWTRSTGTNPSCAVVWTRAPIRWTATCNTWARSSVILWRLKTWLPQLLLLVLLHLCCVGSLSLLLLNLGSLLHSWVLQLTGRALRLCC